MLRMRRASPPGKWIENNAERNAFGRKESDSFRPDTASRDAPRFGNAMSRFPDSQAGLRTRQFRGWVSSGPGPLAFPFADKRTVAFGATRTDLPLRGQCRDGWGWTPGRTGFPFHPAREGNARRTPATLIIATLAAGALQRADLL